MFAIVEHNKVHNPTDKCMHMLRPKFSTKHTSQHRTYFRLLDWAEKYAAVHTAT